MLTANTILQNRYLIVRQLGQGGMGWVYEAVDQRVNCVVAVKETMTIQNAESRRAFEREAALLANLRHRGLPKVMDYFSENDGDFLIMEFISGHDLAELLDLRGSPFPQAEVLRWADDLLSILEYLHGRQPPILHRDIKPSNVKLTKDGELFLLDFGLAKGAAGQMPTLVTSRSVHGYTPVYAPLEQILGQGTDPRSDLYSAAATLYNLLTGIPPIDAPTRFHAIEDDRPDPLKPIEVLNPAVSPNVASIIHGAMSISRKQRPPSVTEMRLALKQVAEEIEAEESERRRAEEERKRRDEGEAAKRVEEERQRKRAAEAEAAKRAEEERERKQTEEADRVARETEKERQRTAEEEERARKTQPAIVETQPPPEQAKDAGQKTLPAPPPPPFRFAKENEEEEDDDAEAVDDETPKRPHWSPRFQFLVGAVIIGVIVAAILPFAWLFKSRDGNVNAPVTSQGVIAGETPAIKQASPSPTATPEATPILLKVTRAPGDLQEFARGAEAYSGSVDVMPVDLNNDGAREYLAQYEMSGSGGAPTHILQRQGPTYRDIGGDVSDLFLFRPLDRATVRVGPKATRGYLDLEFDGQYFVFDGRSYKCSRGC